MPIARKELIAQRAEAGLLADGDLGQATGLGKFAGWLWNSWRRDVELLGLLEEKVERDSTPSLQEYLAQKSAEIAAAQENAPERATGPLLEPATDAEPTPFRTDPQGEPSGCTDPGRPPRQRGSAPAQKSSLFRTDPGDPPRQHPE